MTCRDWFQLSLKEGLTVFRDQEFSSDLHSRAVQRIDDVTHLRKLQFSEDSSPLAHPIRPDNYIEINNFYTMTVYEKGAEVIRMLRTILGERNYRKGTDLYFSRHDGQAVTCDDFVQAMQDASSIDLSQFRLWYSQAGTPQITFTDTYDPKAQSYTVTLKQHIPDTAGQTDKKPMVIPFAMGLMAHNGTDLIGTETLLLTKEEQNFTFPNIHAKPTPSLLRNFSAPVKLEALQEDSELAFLMAHDTDGFNRWESAQRYTLLTLGHMMETGGDVPPCFIETFGTLIKSALHNDSDKALMARILTLPDIDAIGQHQAIVNPDIIFAAREKVLSAVKRVHKNDLEKLYTANAPDAVFSATTQSMARRALRNVALALLTATCGTGCGEAGAYTLFLRQYDDGSRGGAGKPDP